jgi:hypothetical protein
MTTIPEPFRESAAGNCGRFVLVFAVKESAAGATIILVFRTSPAD